MHACVQQTLFYNLGVVIVCVFALGRLDPVCKFTIKNGTKTSKICFGRVFVKWSAMLYLPAMCSTRKCPWRTLSASQKYRMSILFARFLLSLLSARPNATVLSMRSRVGGWGYPKSARVLRCCTARWAAIKADPNSASATDATTQSINLAGISDGTVDGVGFPKVPEPSSD